MSIRNILVACNDAEGAPNALLFGGTLAKRHDAHLTGLLATAAHESYAAESRWIPDEVRAIIARANADAAERIEKRFRDFGATLGLGDRLHFARAEGRVDAVVAQMARSFDILLLDQLASDVDDHHLLLHPDRIALQSGRPVMLVPKTFDTETRFSNAILAWDGRRAAARAFADALDLLEPGATLSILTVGQMRLPRPVEEIAAQVARHGLTPLPAQLPATTNEAEAVLDFCREQSADLLIMGAYEHSKFRTEIFGSMSSTVLRKCPAPVIISH